MRDTPDISTEDWCEFMNYIPYADDVETIPIDEAEDIQKVVLALKSILSRSHAKSGEFRADVHGSGRV